MLDDLGVDKIASYQLGTDPPATPTLDGLAAEGLQFDRAWAHPVCSPTRAALLTGQEAWRTGIGLGMQPQVDTFELDDEVWTLPRLLEHAPTPYASAALGKWHLGTEAGADSLDPLAHGFGYHAGSLANLVDHQSVDDQPQSYSDWEKSIDGVRSRTTTYATVDTTDEALDAVTTLPEPWLVWAAYNAPHTPLHVPPPGLYPGPIPETRVERYDAMVSALDQELGRLLAGMAPELRERTVVVVLGDNGTEPSAVQAPLTPDRAKQSVYEGGVRVPLIVAGPGIRTGRTDALVADVDLYATLADLAGVPEGDEARLGGVDSVSFAPHLEDPAAPPARDHVYTERFRPNGFGPYQLHDRAIRDAEYKLITRADGSAELYRLGSGWLEGEDLLVDPDAEAIAARDRLLAALDTHQP